jgi:hypothetical protein
MSNFVTEFKARKSTRNLNFGSPLVHCLCTSNAGADQGDFVSRMTPFCNMFSTCFHFLSLSRGQDTGVSLSVVRCLLWFDVLSQWFLSNHWSIWRETRERTLTILVRALVYRSLIDGRLILLLNSYTGSFFIFFRFLNCWVSLLSRTFILSTISSVTSAMPSTVALGIVSSSSLKLATIVCAFFCSSHVSVLTRQLLRIAVGCNLYSCESSGRKYAFSSDSRRVIAH